MKLREALGWPLLVSAWTLLLSASLWAQSTPAPPVPAVSGSENAGQSDQAVGPDLSNPDTDSNSTRMLTPPPASGGTYPVAVGAEERANFLRGGVTFNSAYSDNVLAGLNGKPVSSVSYSIWPTLALDETSSRLHWVLSYAPGFTFYQKVSSYNESDEDVGLDFSYRLSPHITFSARDGLQKSSNVFDSPGLGAAGVVSGGVAAANPTVIAPLADRLSNGGSVGLAYQFGADSMIGVSGSFFNLHYPSPAQVPGLFDSASQSGSGFYAVRLAKRHYVGAIYQYQRLLSYPAAGTNETQTHAALVFYTLYLSPKFSVSLFGGPQYGDSSSQFAAAGTAFSGPAHSWKPDAGGSVSWQGVRGSAALSYVHAISGGGGLLGAVTSDSAGASVRRQIVRSLDATMLASYSQNQLLVAPPLAGNNGHTVSGTATLQQFVGQHFNLQLGYSRLHQDYSAVAALAVNPDTNREFVAVSYQFSRALGR